MGDTGTVVCIRSYVHGLRGRQLAHWRQHAVRVAAKHDDILRVGPDAGDAGVPYKLDRVGGARVFGERAVVEVHVAAALCEERVCVAFEFRKTDIRVRTSNPYCLPVNTTFSSTVPKRMAS